MVANKVSSLFLSLLLQLTASPPRSLRCQAYVRQEMVLHADEFRVDKIKALAETFVANSKNAVLATLLIGTSDEYLAYYSGKGVSGSNFDNWQHRLSLAEANGWKPLQNLAEVTVVDRQGIVRIRRDGVVTEIVITDRNPLEIGTDGIFEIIEIAGGVTKPPESSNELCLDHITVFLRTKAAVSQAALIKVSALLHRLTPRLDLYTVVRNDSWFISHSEFPPVFAFENPVAIPTRAQYRDGRELMRFSPGEK